MAHKEVSALKKEEKDRLVCTYAALLLHDDNLEINVSIAKTVCWFVYASLTLFVVALPQEEKLSKVIKASGNEVEGYWPGLFAKALKGQDIGALLRNIGSGPAAGGAAAGGAPAAAEEAAPA